MVYTRMPVIPYSELYHALIAQYGLDAVDDVEWESLISEDAGVGNEVVYFDIKNFKVTEDEFETTKLNMLRTFLQDIFPDDEIVLIDFIV